jgi:hypothetical protein
MTDDQEDKTNRNVVVSHEEQYAIGSLIEKTL